MYDGQVTLSAIVPTLLLLLGLVGIVIILVGVLFFDAGLSRSGNAMHTLVQKLTVGFVAAAGFSVIGFAIWNYQFSRAFASIGTPGMSFGDTVKSWWLGGDGFDLPQHLDPRHFPNAEQYHMFFAIFVVYAAFFAMLLASAVIERVETLPLTLIALVFGAVILPIAGFLVYGPVGPLSNRGTHEFGGSFFYILLGTWALVLAWRAKPRPGAFSTGADHPQPHNLVYTVIGTFLYIVGLAAFVLANGWLVLGDGTVEDGFGYFGITFSQSGMGLVATNLIMAFAAASVGGLVVWKLTDNPFYFLVAPIGGWIAVSGNIDVIKPWQAVITALFAPFIVWVGAKAMHAIRVDDPKIVPLTLGPGIYSALMTALFAHGIPQGGYSFLGPEDPADPTSKIIDYFAGSDYQFWGAAIGWGQQLLGIAIFLGIGLLSALIVVFAIEKTVGLRDGRIDNGHDADLDLAVIGLGAYPRQDQDRPTTADREHAVLVAHSTDTLEG